MRRPDSWPSRSTQAAYRGDGSRAANRPKPGGTRRSVLVRWSAGVGLRRTRCEALRDCRRTGGQPWRVLVTR